MTGSLKDVSSAEMVRSLAEMNCFEQDCTVYGYSWKSETGKRMYRMSEDALLIRQSFESHLLHAYAMTPLQSWTRKAIIKEETKEDLFLSLKLELAGQLRSDFNEVYFSGLQNILKASGDNQAEPLLLQWQEELDGYFEEERLQLFAGAVTIAYVTKHLQKWRYQQLMQWIGQTKKQMTNGMQIRDNFTRAFYGVVCKPPQATSYRYLCNANQNALYDQIKELDEKGVWHTPVYSKCYWYHKSGDLPNVRKLFETDLKELMDETYLNRMMAIQNFSSAIPQQLWDSNLQKVKAECSPIAYKGFLYWGQRWNIGFTE